MIPLLKIVIITIDHLEHPIPISMSLSDSFVNTLHHFSAFIFSIGLFANLFCIIILCQKSQRRLSINLYLIALAVSDFGTLLIAFIDKWRTVVYNLSLRNTSVFFCKALPFFERLFLNLSSWIVVMITVERARAIKSPLGGNFTRGRAWLRDIIVLLITTTVLTVIYTPTLIFYKFTERLSGNGTKKTNCISDEPKQYHLIKYIIFNSVYSFIPCAILCVCVYIIIERLIKRKRFLASQGNIHSDRQDQNDNIIRLVICINIMFVVFTFPFAVLGMILTFSDRTTEYANSVLKPIYRFTHILSYINSFLNFFIYIISGRSFRKEFVKLFKQPLRRLRKKYSHTDPTSQLSLKMTTVSHI